MKSRGSAVAAAVLAMTAGLIWLAAAPASAHAGLVRSVPGDGSTVTTAPEQVQLVFDENVRTPANIVVTGPSGGHVEQGRVRLLDNTATVRVDGQAPGRYTVAFRVVSADGHPVAGQIGFRFAPGGTAQTGSAPPSAQERPTHAEHAASSEGAADDGLGTGPIAGIVAGTALVAGLALLTARRRPDGALRQGAKDRP